MIEPRSYGDWDLEEWDDQERRINRVMNDHALSPNDAWDEIADIEQEGSDEDRLAYQMDKDD